MTKFSNVAHLERIPADVVQAMQVVDDSAAKEIEQTLQQSRQGGYLPSAAEEKAQHRAQPQAGRLPRAVLRADLPLQRARSKQSRQCADQRLHERPGDPRVGRQHGDIALLRDVRPLVARVGRHREEGRPVVLAGDHRRGLGRTDGGTRLHQDRNAADCAAAADRRLRSGLLPDGGVVPGAILPTVRPGISHRVVLRQLCDCRRVRGHHRVRLLPDQRVAAWVAVSLHHRGRLLAGHRAGDAVLLATGPGTAWFLTPTERRYAENRMMIDAAANFDSTHKLSWRDVTEALLDWKLWLVLPFNILQSVPPQGFTIFFPTVVKGLGYSGPTANPMTVPPYVIGAAFLLLFSFVSDHYHTRLWPILVALVIDMIGLVMTITLPLDNIGGRYAGLVILLAGTFIASPITVTWLAGNTPEPGKRTVVLGINGWGNLAGIIGSEIILAKYGPTYRVPLGITLGLVGVSFVGYAGYGIALRVVNCWKARKVAAMTAEEIEEENRGERRYADRKYTFVYGL
ncbi:hypothetical protein VTN96DRAFT_9886 [Rasamsonia emersonii]